MREKYKERAHRKHWETYAHTHTRTHTHTHTHTHIYMQEYLAQYSDELYRLKHEEINGMAVWTYREREREREGEREGER